MRLGLLAFFSALALLAASGSAFSQEKQHSGLYVGGSVGQATMDYASDAVPVSGATQSSLSKDERNAAFKVFVGYRINDYFALEGGYSNYGTFSATREVAAPVTGSVRADTKVSGGHLDGLLIYPMDRFSVFARLGVMATNTRTVYTATGVTPNNTDATKRELNARFGLGAGYEFNKVVGARFEYERVLNPGNERTGDADISMFSLGLVLKF
jgi:OOP family OmpA-OmpF porin